MARAAAQAAKMKTGWIGPRRRRPAGEVVKPPGPAPAYLPYLAVVDPGAARRARKALARQAKRQRDQVRLQQIQDQAERRREAERAAAAERARAMELAEVVRRSRETATLAAAAAAEAKRVSTAAAKPLATRVIASVRAAGMVTLAPHVTRKSLLAAAKGAVVPMTGGPPR